ncbi:MAG: GAF domain-containing protein [Cyanobacteria bacterium J06636_16]
MVGVNLKKVVLKKELSLIQDFINVIDPNLSIQSAEGHLILEGKAHAGSHRYPIALDGQILGWVNGNEQAGAIANLISRLAHRELEKLALAQELLSKYKEIALLFNLSEKIIDSPDVNEVASLVLEEAQQLLKSSNGSLLIVQSKAKLLESIASFGPNPLFTRSVPLGDGIIGAIVKTGRGEIINNVTADPRHHYVQSSRVTSLICVPLKSKEATIGAIALSRPQQQPYTAEDLKLLTTLACQAAGVINALLHERQLKESRQNDLIFRLSSQIRESLELDAVLNTAVNEIYSALDLDRCCFLWCQTSSENSHHTDWPRNSAPLSQAIAELEIVTESKRSSLAPFIGTYDSAAIGQLPQWFRQEALVRVDQAGTLEDEATRQFLQTHGFAALLAIPIQTRSGRIGVICCGRKYQSAPWSDSEVTLLQAITNQLAIALDQAELYDHSRRTAHLAQEKAQQLAAALETLQQTQLQLLQSEKMSSIGQMVAGVAHEINNPVNFIHGNLEYVREYAQDLFNLVQLYQAECRAPSKPLQKAIKDIDLEFVLEDLPKIFKSMVVGTDRIKEIVLSLKNFSRLDQAEFKRVDIHEGIDSTLLILSHRLKPQSHFPGIKLIKDYGDLPPVECYPGQLNQVFMNLLANAIDALEDSWEQTQKLESRNQKPWIGNRDQDTEESQESGVRSQELELKTQNSKLPHSSTPPLPHSFTITIQTQKTSSNHIQIRITDNGSGIPSSVKARLFDPFFTTKDVGKGTGLGLSISYQIITERHGGTLRCQSESGRGTEFIIEIPLWQGDRKSGMAAVKLTPTNELTG